ncbi:Putative esterase superfamily [Verrucomicrobiia bacterium DG1235]|nr:Putative esterase superfamily [Verrucomicrobiae bacterium DG1235]
MFILILFPFIAFSQEATREFEYTIEYPGLHHPLTVKVKVPADYDSSDQGYGVLYYTDSAISYGFVNDLVETLSWEQLPKLITVGIDVTPEARSKGRNFILTPTAWEVMESYLDVTSGEMGGAPIFLECIKQKIVPMIEEEFRTVPGERTLMGHSFGGLFGLFALFEEPSYFKNYVVGSPSLFWDEKLMLKLENEYSKNNDNLGVNLFMAVGTAEDAEFVDMDADLQEFVEHLQSRNYQGLNLGTKVWDGQQHMASMFLSYTEGVGFVFADAKPEVGSN